MQQQASGSLRSTLTGIALSTSLALVAPAIGQPRGQGPEGPHTATTEGSSRISNRNDEGDAAAPRSTTVDAQTGKILNEAIELMNQNNYTGAAEKLSTLQLDRLSPYERGRVETILLNVSTWQEKYEEARGHAQKAIESGGLNAQEIEQMRYQHAMLYIQEDKWREGAAALEEWFKTASNPNSSAYYLLAAAYYQLEDLERALPPAKKAVELMDPAKPNENWLSMLSALHLQRDEYREAIPVLNRLVAAAPDKKMYWLQLSQVYGQLEDYQNALAIMQLANNVGLVTEDAEVRRLADLLVFNDVPYRGAQVLEAAIEKQWVTLDDKLYEKLANCWMRAGELDRAIAPLAQAGELAQSGDLFLRLGELHVQRDDWDAAIAAIQRGIDKGQLKDPAYAQLMLGIAHYSKKNYKEAVPYFDRARQTDKHREMADSYLKAIRAEG